MTVPVVDRQAAQNFPMLVEYCILGLLVVAVIVKALDFFVNVLKYVIFGGLSSSGVLKKKSLLMFLSLVSLFSIIALLLTVNVILGYEVEDIFIVQCIFFAVLWVISPPIPLLCIGTLCREIEAKLFKFCILSFIVGPIFTGLRIIMEANVVHSSKFLSNSIESLRKSQEAHTTIGAHVSSVQDNLIMVEGLVLEKILMKTAAFRMAFFDSMHKKRQLKSIDGMCQNLTDDLVGLCVDGFNKGEHWVDDQYGGFNHFVGSLTVKVGRKVVCSEIREESRDNSPCDKYYEEKDKIEAFSKAKEKDGSQREAEGSLAPLEVETKGGRVVASSGEIGIGSIGGSYNDYEYCVWEIEVPEGLVIQITWEYFDLEGPSPLCPYDYVDISEYATGESLTGKICGSGIPPPVRSRSNVVVVTFSSDVSVVFQGFRLHFEAIALSSSSSSSSVSSWSESYNDQYETSVPTETSPATQLPPMNCSVDTGRIVASSGEIGIGSIGGSYNNNEYCVWEIQVPEGLIIQFTWGYFNLEGPSPGCPYDYVDISEYGTGESLTGVICGSSIPQSVRSHSNMVRVTFRSDYSVTLQGFSLQFEAVSDQYETTAPTAPEVYETTQLPQMFCSVNAGRIVAPSGEIGIGSIGGSYNDYENCVWEIQVPEGLVIQFTWEYFDVEGPSPWCPYDYVDIAEYGTGKSLTGRICGSSIPQSVRSRSNFVRVTFNSDYSVTLQGFRLHYEAVSEMPTTEWIETTQLPPMNCSVETGRIVAYSGEIGIGSIGGSYNINEYCVWEIEVPEGLVIQFTWEYFDVEGPSPWCPYDYVDISEYETGESLTGRICGSSIPQPVRSRSNTVRVTFNSDFIVTLQGFMLQFEAIAGDCDTIVPTTPTTWYETSQLPEMNCSVDAGRIVAYSGEIGIGSIGGSYNNNEYCVWEIEVPEGLIIKFTWEYFALEGPSPGCPFDYVDISEYESGESLTGRICGSSIPWSVRSQSNKVRVTFSSDYSVTLQGFALQFEATSDQYETTIATETATPDWYETTRLPQTNCSVDTGRVVASSGEIGIGSIGGSYNDNEYCIWEIQVPEGQIIKFTWGYFNLEGPSSYCPYDYVDISEYETGESLTGRICGSESPPSVTSQSNLVVVTFISDVSVTLPGFRLNFQAIPGGVSIP